MAGVATFLSDPTRPIESTLRLMMATPHLAAACTRSRLRPHANSPNKSDNERSGCCRRNVVPRPLSIRLRTGNVTLRWRISDLVEADHPLASTLSSRSDISRTKPLVRLILNQIGRRLTETSRCRTPAQAAVDADEFAALAGSTSSNRTRLQAGYAIRAFLICQSLNQLAKAYGENSVLDNCHVRIAFA